MIKAEKKSCFELVFVAFLVFSGIGCNRFSAVFFMSRRALFLLQESFSGSSVFAILRAWVAGTMYRRPCAEGSEKGGKL